MSQEGHQHNQDEEEIRRIRKEMSETIDRIQEKNQKEKQLLTVELEQAKSEMGSPRKLQDAKIMMRRVKTENEKLKKKLREYAGKQRGVDKFFFGPGRPGSDL